ncbi:MAG: carboxypeptidase-like regulatory domain-containing protein, partial [Gemmatimonadota bacterium]|nr:carboxypeptidase-like regulatory domain-containing protein [Gemmatimonadota bacterium]
TKLGATADEKGRFFILNVPAGTYTLKATYIGYADYTVEDVRVSADLTTNIAVELTSSDIQVEEVVIRAERPIIDKTATNAVRIIDAEDLDILPLRGVSSVIALQTGVVEDEGSLHIRGSRSDEIGYYVEGASVRNVVTGSSAVGLIDEALEEIQLQAGGFNAEYGGANAGIILQELRTGGSEWDFEILSESDNFTDDYEQRFSTYSYGYFNQVMTAGGPVAGSQKIRAFLAGQRRGIGSWPIYWSGFTFEDLEDTGLRGGRRHWSEDEEGNLVPDRIEQLEIKPGNIPHTSSEAVIFNGTLLLDYYPVQLRLTNLYTDGFSESNYAPIRNAFNTRRLGESESSSNLVNAKITHLLDKSMFYELNVSLYKRSAESYDPLFKDRWWVYNDSVAVQRALEGTGEYTPYTQQGSGPRPYDLAGFPFSRPGSRTTSYSTTSDGYWGLAGSWTKQTDMHQLKAGFDYQSWTSRRYGISLRSIRSGIANTYPELDAVYDRYYNDEISEDQILDELLKKAESLEDGKGSKQDLVRLLRSTSASDFFGFDEFGRETDREGLEAPRHPTVAAAFIQDKVEYNDLIINAGLRIDYFDADSWRFKDPAAPKRDSKEYTIKLESMEKTPTYTDISPRLGMSFPVSDLTVFHVQYGRFSQMPAMRSMYAGGARLALELGGQNYIRYPTAYDIEPMRTTQYEIGFERQFSESASFDVTGFYRDIKGQVQLRKQQLTAGAEEANAYVYLQNGDFATTKGIEFQFKLRRVNNLRTELNYTLSDARGTGSYTGSAISGVENETNLPTIISPLDFNETHRGSIFLDYRYPDNEPNPILRGLGANLLMSFTSGHNFTLVTGSIGQRGPENAGVLDSFDPRSRKPLESINRSTTPWTFNTNLRIDKGFSLFGLNAKVYSRILNLFNRKNVLNVYNRTGSDKDDGFLTNPELSQQIVEASGGQQYVQLYEAINLANRQAYWSNEGGDIYDAPRQIRFGLQLDF